MLVPPKVFSLWKASSDDVARLGLNGIYLHRLPSGEASACATDGKMLVTAQWKEDNWEEYPVLEGVTVAPKAEFSVTIPRNACKDAEKLAGKNHTGKPILSNIVIDEEKTMLNGAVYLHGYNLDEHRTMAPAKIDGTYPDYRVAIKSSHLEPTSAPHGVFYHPIYFATVLDIVRGFTKDPLALIHVSLHAEKPAEITLKTEEILVRGLVMPCSEPKY